MIKVVEIKNIPVEKRKIGDKRLKIRNAYILKFRNSSIKTNIRKITGRVTKEGKACVIYKNL